MKNTYLVIPIILIWFSILLIQTKVSTPVDHILLFGDKRFSFFDLWSIQHFFSGILIGYILKKFFPEWFKKISFILFVLLLALIWEFSELFMEYGLFGELVSNWKAGFELIFNRLLIDPLLVVSGAVLAWKYNRSLYFALGPMIIWLVINLISPDSMYIQNKFIGLL